MTPIRLKHCLQQFYIVPASINILLFYNVVYVYFRNRIQLDLINYLFFFLFAFLIFDCSRVKSFLFLVFLFFLSLRSLFFLCIHKKTFIINLIGFDLISLKLNATEILLTHFSLIVTWRSTHFKVLRHFRHLRHLRHWLFY